MKSVPIPQNFNGLSFLRKFNLDENGIYVAHGHIFYDEIKVGKVLEPTDIADCITDMDALQRIKDRESTSKADAKNIPGWATWDEQQALEWANNHISDTQIDAIGNLADAKVLLKDMSKAVQGIARLEIAIRDKLWPDLPEDDIS